MSGQSKPSLQRRLDTARTRLRFHQANARRILQIMSSAAGNEAMQILENLQTNVLKILKLDGEDWKHVDRHLLSRRQELEQEVDKLKEQLYAHAVHIGLLERDTPPEENDGDDDDADEGNSKNS